MKTERFSRTRLLLGEKAVLKLGSSRVAVFGLGGVGSYAVEALARSGVGNLRLVDFDEIKYSNFNRQLFALESTIGRRKIDIAAERVAEINPDCVVERHAVFADENTAPGLLAGADAAIDAIDSLSCKVALLAAAAAAGCAVVSAMGASTRRDPFAVRVADISETDICPLAKQVRKRLRAKGIFGGIRCVYSVEPAAPAAVSPVAEPETHARGRGRSVLGSLSYMPGLFGLVAARETIEALLKQ